MICQQCKEIKVEFARMLLKSYGQDTMKKISEHESCHNHPDISAASGVTRKFFRVGFD